MTYFVLYNLKALMDSADRFENYLKRKMAEEHDMKAKLSGRGLNDRQIRVVAGIMDGDTVTVRSIVSQHKVSLNTARANIRALVDAGILVETGREVNMKVYSWSGNET
jgi:Fic family protein